MSDVDLSQAVLTRLRDAVDAREVVGQHVALRQRGRRWIGLCPFHEEKTPSFSVDPERGLYYCFGCHAGGDVIDFVMRLERLSFPEAVTELARRFGVTLPERDPNAARRRQEVDRLRTVLEEAQAWFVEQLGSSDGAAARRELERRGFSPGCWAEFGFGWAPDDWRRLLDHLSRRHTDRALVAAGLAVVPERGGRPYDRFRSRVTFPIRAADGRLIAFGGRALGAAEPKYLNSPEGPLFAKRSTLFLLDRARRAVADGGTAVVVEGYFDALSLHRVGVTSAVATLGTALTADHARLLRRLAQRVLLAYDADPAGRRAAVAGAKVLLESGLEVAMLGLPAGVDPDDLVREGGAAAVEEVLARPVPLLDALLSELPDDPAARRRSGIAVAEVVAAARDPVIRFGLLEGLARRLDLPLEVLLEHGRGGPRGNAQAALRPSGGPSAGERNLARILIDGPATRRDQLLEIVDPDMLADARVRSLFAAARNVDQPVELDPAAYCRRLLDALDDPEATRLVAELVADERPALDDPAVANQLRVLAQRQRAERARRLQRAIETAESEGDRAEADRLLAEKVRIWRKPADS